MVVSGHYRPRKALRGLMALCALAAPTLTRARLALQLPEPAITVSLSGHPSISTSYITDIFVHWLITNEVFP